MQFEFDAFSDFGLRPIQKTVEAEPKLVYTGGGFNPGRYFTKSEVIAMLQQQRIRLGTTLPASALNGDMFFKTSTSVLYVYYGGWVAISGGGSPPTHGDSLKLESGDYILLESGDRLLLE